MVWINIFLHLIAAMALTGHFSAPCFSSLSTQHTLHSALSRPALCLRRSYTGDFLRSVRPAPIDPSLIPRLRELGIGYHLASRRSCRGGRRKNRRIPVISSLPHDGTFHRDVFVDTEPWTADMLFDLQPSQRHVTSRNLTRVTSVSNKNNDNLKLGTLRVASFNAQSLGPDEKRTAVTEFMKDWNIDILFVQETWFNPKGDECKIASLATSGFSVKSFPRNSRGGGIAVIFKDYLSNYLSFKTQFDFRHRTFELVLTSFSYNEQTVNLACIYRTFPSRKNKLTDKMFFDDSEFPDFLDFLNNLPGSALILGDVNFHYDDKSKTYVTKMIDLLDSFSLSQSVDQTTHKKGHIIDWIIHRPSDNLLRFSQVTQELASDHFCVVAELNISIPSALSQTILTRKIKAIDRDAFKRDLSDRISPARCDSIEALNTSLAACLDKHAPVCRRKVRSKQEDPWFPDIRVELKEAKQNRRKAERVWFQSGKLTVFQQIYTRAKNFVTGIIERARLKYYSEKISSCSSSKQLFGISNTLAGKEKSSPLPTCFPLSDLPDIFCHFFLDKTAKIRKELDDNPLPKSALIETSCSFKFDIFQPVSEEDVRKTIMSSKPTSCPLDPIPTPLLIEFLDTLLPSITNLVNQSLASGIFPQSFKTAVVRPLLKKSSLDQNTLKNYRPVSNLSFLSKIFEKIALQQLFSYLNTHNLLPHNQSAYRPAHSTETALIRVTNDILSALDRGEVTILTLLDLSAAFDTVDHDILFSTLRTHFGISGTVLSWFESYLTNRTQKVVIGDQNSESKDVIFGVPQGSVLGPVLFLMYTKPLLDFLDQKQIPNQSFADDTQLYRSSTPSLSDEILSELQNCVTGIRGWMSENKLKLNDEKTEAILFHSKSSFNSEQKPSSILVGDAQIPFANSARNLGFMITEDMSLETHISHTCRTAYIAIRQISTIRKYLTIQATKTLVCAFVLSRLDYCNALLSGCPHYLLNKLQKVQNSAARLVLQAKKFDHVTPLLHKLHWLPIQARIEYKLSVHCHNFFINSSPHYLSTLLSVYTPNRTLRSSADTHILTVPVINTARFGERSFSYCAARQWNSLPKFLREIQTTPAFKKALKTYLFKKHLE